jgi:predicted XRE-type DNA-binding protein
MTDPNVTPSSGNVFTDLALHDADELQAKAEMMFQIRQSIKQRGLTQVQAARLLGVDQADVSNLINGKLRSVSLERLTGFLNKLDLDVEIVWHEKTGDKARTIAHAR